ncbi:hypothetical protein BVX97_04080 [bacterium E08(2017)]|nr:hypothetical protein BVX97_04080 [bacterium E08(2017)]
MDEMLMSKDKKQHEVSDVQITEASVIEVIKLADLLSRIGNKDIFGKSLSQAQFHYLMVIKREDANGVSQKLIQDSLATTKGNISIHTAKLIAKGLIRRKTSNKDARYNVVTLTAKGRNTLEELEPKYVTKMKELTSQLHVKQAETIYNAMLDLQTKCREMLGEKDEIDK